ncbi:leukocyte elastase inhibitor isoform X7 [Leptinotarsa decemlineata]|uniref:leukocyte elastase inhibitor isoform X7 n=1 Tax=Leptinotarsa decemlineata TaxID=7539 RepID=UPI003D30A173
MWSGITILLLAKVLAFFLCLPIYSCLATDMAETAVLKGSSDFTKNLYKILSRGEGNVFFSPISIHAILSLASQGAGGATKDALTSALNVPDIKVAAEGYKAIMSRLNNIAEVTLHMANKVFLKENYKLQEAFQSIVTSHFLSEVDLVNFAENIKAAKTINSWVEQKTNNKIKDLIDSGDLDSDTRLVLVNAIYFKGKWAEPFNPSQTKTEKFYLDGTEHNTVDVQMMHLKKKFYFKIDETLDAKVLELPYTNKDISMLIILPNDKNGIAKLEEKLSQTDLTKITENMYRPEVMVSLPKFKIEQTIDLKDSLTELGLGNMFSDTADFSGMLDSSEPLCVSKVVQKAFIEVNEEGAEAAAATGNIVRRKMCGRDLPEEFLADHPFFIINCGDKRSLIMFECRVLNPLNKSTQQNW